MAIEIERKFLVLGDAWRDQVSRSEVMAQGYLGGERASVRLRVVGERAFLNIKSRQAGSRRLEFEYAVPRADAEQMLAELALPGQIHKTRHYVAQGPHVWEVDEFAGDNAGLVVAEIELDSEDEVFERPDWIGAEVTHEMRYYNNALAQHPYCDWVDSNQEPAC